MMWNKWIALSFFVFLAACGEPNPTFYKLSAEGTLPLKGKTSLGIGPIIVPEYANRRNLVIETSPNRLEVVLSHRWAGALDESIARVMATNLGRKIGTNQVQVYPWQRDSEIDYQIAIHFTEFLAKDDGYAYLEGSWRVYELPGSQLRSTHSFVLKEPILSRDYEAVVNAKSRLLGKLASSISEKTNF